MTTKQKSGAGTTIVALLAVAALGAVVYKVKGTDVKTETEVDEVISLSVTFTPTPRREPVNIYVNASSFPPINERPSNSPWNKTTTVRKGEQVAMHVTQFQPGRMDCFIHRKGKQIAHDFREDAGGIHCWMNRKDEQ